MNSCDDFIQNAVLTRYTKEDKNSSSKLFFVENEEAKAIIKYIQLSRNRVVFCSLWHFPFVSVFSVIKESAEAFQKDSVNNLSQQQ